MCVILNVKKLILMKQTGPKEAGEFSYLQAVLENPSEPCIGMQGYHRWRYRYGY
jgi:hypothetical protein